MSSTPHSPATPGSASGRTAEQMLTLLHRRLGNDPATESAIVRDELAKINRIRLRKLLEGA